MILTNFGLMLGVFLSRGRHASHNVPNLIVYTAHDSRVVSVTKDNIINRRKWTITRRRRARDVESCICSRSCCFLGGFRISKGSRRQVGSVCIAFHGLKGIGEMCT